jgi:uncharacterized repeat protein (TIGR01451 family)
MNVFGLFPPKVSADAGPDLIVEDIALSPENPAIGDTVTITVTIKNQGTASAGTSYVTCYVDSTILESKSISAIDAGIMATATFTWQATQGTHTIRAIADASGIITETDETNNTDTYTLTTLAPDLILQSITWSPAYPSSGDSVVFSIVIKNQGNIQSRYTNVNFFIDANDRGTQDVAAINPGASLTKTYSWTALTGQHTLKAVVDVTDNNKESDETNNELTVIFTTGSLDLAFQAVTWSPQNPSKYDTVTCNATVINYGEGRADSWSLAYFLDGTLKPTISGTPLEAGATVNITFSWQTLQDKHDIRIVLDYYNQLNEIDETNNEYNVTITTLVPDLVVSDITWLPANPGAGDNVIFTVKIKNQGSGRAAASRAASYIDNRFISYLNVSSLNATAEATATFSWLATSGTHSIKIIADYDDTLNEQDRDNNDTNVTITVAPPDLIIQNISWSPEDPTLDETVTFTVNIKNQGAGRALNFHVAFLMDDALLKSELIPRLDAGASVNATYDWKVLNGRHTFKAIVNYNNYMIESDKTNNENSIIFAPKLPDLAITGIIWSPSDISAGYNVIFSITIENQGLISAAPSRIAFYVDGAVAGYVDIGRLEPGIDTLEHFTWAASDGFHTINIILDSNNQLAEIDEANNTMVINIPLPDLIVEDITFSPPDIDVGDNLTITAFVKNQGNSKTEISQVSFYVDGVKIAFQELPSIDSGESSAQVFYWAAEAGIHTFKFTIDDNNTVIEFNETNNEKETNHATATPDLIIEGMSWIMSDQMNSNEATFTITIKNIGTGAAGESQVKYSFDSSPADIKKIAAIPAGETVSFSFIAILSTGQHTATIIADYEDAITELDEDNNQKAISFSTIASDLVVRTISYSPLDATIGDTITLTVTLENRGIAKATNVRLTLSIDGSVTDFKDLPEIDLATSATLEFQWIVTEGEHEIIAFVDAEQTNIESNEQNNTKSRILSFAATNNHVVNFTGTPTSSPAEGGLIEKWWWLLLLLAGLLIAAAFASTFRALRKR